jgi:hypothetical protein
MGDGGGTEGSNRAPTSVDNTLAGAQNLEVSVAHLENIGAYLDVVVSAISDSLRPMVFEAHRLARTGGDTMGGSALGSAAFPEATDLALRAQQTFDAVDSSLKGMATNLQKVADGIRDMAENYRTTEERNGLTAADFARVLSGG